MSRILFARGNTYHCDVTVICVARNIRVPPLHISLVEWVFIPSDMCSSTQDTHIASGSVLLREKHISLVICVPYPGIHIPSGMCFSYPGTIPRDMRISNPRFQGQIPNSEKPIWDPQTSSPTFKLILALLTLSLNYGTSWNTEISQNFAVVINLYIEAYKPQATVLITCSRRSTSGGVWREIASCFTVLLIQYREKAAQ